MISITDSKAFTGLIEQGGRLKEAVANPPEGLHPFIWRSGLALAFQVGIRVVDRAMIGDVLRSGVVACGSLGLADSPGEFLVVRFGWRRYWKQALIFVQRHALTHMRSVMVSAGASGDTLQVGTLCVAIALNVVDTCVTVRCEPVVSVVTNCVLGVEILQRVAREVLSMFPPAALAVTDAFCAGVGFWGLVHQARSRGLTAESISKWFSR